ncbi:hypothetical protein ACSNOI_04525 [Actinomadura kijaniata]
MLDMPGGGSPPVGGPDVCSVEKLFEKTVGAKAAHRPGDPERPGKAVVRRAVLRVRPRPAAPAALAGAASIRNREAPAPAPSIA